MRIKQHRKAAVKADATAAEGQAKLHTTGSGGAEEVLLGVPSPVQSAFTNIYLQHVWSTAGGGSGPGSTREMTAATISIVRLVANTYDLHSLIDTPCGKRVCSSFKSFKASMQRWSLTSSPMLKSKACRCFHMAATHAATPRG